MQSVKYIDNLICQFEYNPGNIFTFLNFYLEKIIYIYIIYFYELSLTCIMNAYRGYLDQEFPTTSRKNFNYFRNVIFASPEDRNFVIN